jgi:UDP-3-O-[3-hydroxymyristoyl] glucosamine N-acyltransferase
MADKTFTLQELAELTNSSLVGDPHYVIRNVADLENATPEDAAFLANSRYEKAMYATQAGVVFVSQTLAILPNRNFLINESPSRAFQQIIEAFYSECHSLSAFIGIHSTAVVHPSCKLGHDVSIGPYAVIDQNAIIGDRTVISAHCFIGPQVSIGSECLFHPHVIVRERCVIGNRVILQPGAIIGSCGFGYTQDKEGHHHKLNQLGNVEIGDDVEIGANTTIDRGRFKATKIGRGTKIDNSVQIGHGVVIGEHNIIVSQTGLAGSSKTGDYVILAGQVGVGGHIYLADHVSVAAKSGVPKSLPKPGKYGGFPAIPLYEHNRNSVHLLKIQTYVDQIKDLERRLHELEQSLKK